MSSWWNEPRNNPCNPIKTENFNPNWGGGEFTCMHTLNDKEGPWWQSSFEQRETITKVSILNRADCCGGRLKGAKVFIGNELCGTINDAPGG